MSFGQTVANISLSGKTLKVEYTDNTVRYMRHVITVVPESYLYGLDLVGNAFKVNYSDVLATTKANQVLTLTAPLADGDTIKINGSNYVAQTTLTNVDKHFHVTSDTLECISNLAAAINLTTGAVGVDYATDTTINDLVSASTTGNTILTITAKVGGTAANAYTTTETSAVASWGAATMSGGEANGKLDFVALTDSWAAAQ